MIKYLLAGLSLLIFNSTLTAQSIQGNTKDQHNKQALPYVTVILSKAADSVKVMAALSNDNGSYHFENIKPGSYLLIAQTVGYHKLIVPVTVNITPLKLDLSLVQSSKQLKDVNIVGSKPLIESRADRLVFNVQNSLLTAGNNGLELLKMAPLVTISPNGGISLKGKSNVMVMIDGKTIPAESLSGILQGMSAEQIEKLELITSPSAKYDASATGGIINIITKKETTMGINGTANLLSSQSRYGRYSGGMGLNYRNSKFNIYGNVNLRNSKSYKNEDLIRYLQQDDEMITLQSPTELFGKGHSQSFKFGVDYSISKNSVLGFNVDGLFSHTDNLAKAQSIFRNSVGRLDSILTATSHPGGRINFTAYNLNYKNTFHTKGQELTMSLSQSRYSGLSTQDLSGEMTTISSAKPVQLVRSVNNTKSLFNITTFQSDYTYPITNQTTAELGLKDVYTSSANESFNQSVNFSTDNQDLNNTQYKENILAAYLNLSQQIKTLKIQAGLRAEKTNARLNLTGLNTSYLDLFPNISIENKFSERYQLSLVYTSRIDRPNYTSLIPFTVPIDKYTQEVGNPDLKPAYTHTFELSNTFRNISLTLGYTRTKDVISDFIKQNELTKVWSFTKNNFDLMENFNASLVVPLKITKCWNTSNTIFGTRDTYQTAEIGNSSYKRSKFNYNLNSVQTFLLPRNIKAELMLSYNSSSVYGLYDISAYSMINAGVSKTFFDNKATLKLGVNDIFHQAGYKISTNAGNLISNGHSYTDSRRFTMSISYKFGKKIAPAREKSDNEAKGRLNL